MNDNIDQLMDTLALLKPMVDRARGRERDEIRSQILTLLIELMDVRLRHHRSVNAKVPHHAERGNFRNGFTPGESSGLV